MTEVAVWRESWRADPVARVIADRHYNRQSVGAAQFVPPGRCLVLRAPEALWVTSWPFAEYVQHDWAGAWMNSCFRREGGDMQASDMIRQAVAVTRWKWPVVDVSGDRVRWKHRAGDRYLPVFGDWFGNERDGFHRHWSHVADGMCSSLGAAKTLGFKWQGSDDFNVAVIHDGQVVALLWMDEDMGEEPEVLETIRKELLI